VQDLPGRQLGLDPADAGQQALCLLRVIPKAGLAAAGLQLG